MSSVAPFNVIHLACHHEAVRADRSMRVPKSEWEGATLRNSRVACNSLLPLRSPTTSNERYQTGLDRHMSNLGEVREWPKEKELHVVCQVRILLWCRALLCRW